jgi:hypothetical protein
MSPSKHGRVSSKRKRGEIESAEIDFNLQPAAAHDDDED